MKSRLRMYVESLFDGAERTVEVVELREEILQNVIDKYDDLIRNGKSEEEAYSIAVSGIGDINELLRSMGNTTWQEGKITQYNMQSEKENSNEKKSVIKSINSAIWAVVTAVYFLVSFLTGAWHISWLIFIIGHAINEIVKAYFDIRA